MTARVSAAELQPIAEEQVMKSRHRIRTYGEVFTPLHMVDRMLDLVHEDLGQGPDFVNKTFLEPSAGDGNFLVAILHRKLRALQKSYPFEHWPEASLFALASIYGIELLEDNHREAKSFMLDEFLSFHNGQGIPCGLDTNLRDAAAFLIDANVICGNTLTSLNSQGTEIQFSWWNRVANAPGMVQREAFTLASLRNNAFDFAVCDKFSACPIDQVQKELRVHD